MIKIIITGATGMVGEGVLHECLQNQNVSRVLVINRRPCGVTHSKLTELIHSDFFDLSDIEDLMKNYDSCLFCLGISSRGLDEKEYTRITYDLTLNFARTLLKLNPDIVFCYISGEGASSLEKSALMWARVKGKTENALLKLPFKKVYVFRPGYLHPTPGLKNTLFYYKYTSWIYPIIKVLIPNHVSTLKELGLAMINAAINGCDKSRLEVKDIKNLSKRIITNNQT